MSRNSNRKLKKRSEKRRSRQKMDVSRNSATRKCCRSTKKQFRKLKRGKIKCVVCWDTLRSKRKFLECGHSFHKNCIAKWARTPNPTCPVCRRAISTDTRHSCRSTSEIRTEPPADVPGPSPNFESLLIELPVVIIPLLGCRCLLDQNIQPGQEAPESGIEIQQNNQ